jgi:hypothetical protein
MQAGAPTGTGGFAQWVVFTLDSARYALALSAVERIVRAAQITPLPGAPRLEKLLSLEEAVALDEAMKDAPHAR